MDIITDTGPVCRAVQSINQSFICLNTDITEKHHK